MVEPVTMTVGAIAALALTKFLESAASETGKQLAAPVLQKIDQLRAKIWHKLRGIPEVDALQTSIDKGSKVSDGQINHILVPHLETAMKADPQFAKEIQQLAHEINQEINIGQILGRNVMNVYEGSAVQINDPKSPVFTGDISGGNFTFNITNN